MIVGFLLSKVEKYPGGPEFPLSVVANKLYSQYVYDAVCFSAYKHYIKQKRGDRSSKFNIESKKLIEKL